MRHLGRRETADARSRAGEVHVDIGEVDPAGAARRDQRRFLPIGLTRDAVNQHPLLAIRQRLHDVARTLTVGALRRGVSGGEHAPVRTVNWLKLNGGAERLGGCELRE
jgi:hypothetical protein